MQAVCTDLRRSGLLSAEGGKFARGKCQIGLHGHDQLHDVVPARRRLFVHHGPSSSDHPKNVKVDVHHTMAFEVKTREDV